MMTFGRRTQQELLLAIQHERDRQGALQAAGKFPVTPAASDERCAQVWDIRGLVRAGKLAILVEEAGEVSRHVNEALIDPDRYQPSKLQQELIEVAAVALAWAEAVERDDL